MKKNLLVFLAILATCSLAVPISASALEIENPLYATTVVELTYRIVNWLYLLAIITAPVLIIIGGFYFFAAGGNPENISKATKMIIYTLVGLVVILLARGFVALLEKILGVG